MPARRTNGRPTRGVDSGSTMTLGARISFLLLLALPSASQEAESAPRPELTVRQSGPADLVGDDDVVIKAACDQLRKSGGTIILGPGRYTIRRSIILPRNVVLRGEAEAVLALPSPVLTAEPAAVGAQELTVRDARDFAGNIFLQILPPAGHEFFADGVTQKLDLQRVSGVEGQKLLLVDPLLVDLPAGSRVGYPLKILQVHKDGLATIENLTFEGGRIESIPMPGHSQRCAIWSSSPFGYGEELLGPPGRGLVVRHCRFSDWYGRAVALYNQADGLVEGCLFERIGDEAIDLDHYVEGFRIVGNEVRDAVFGIVLNDASRNVVEYNRIEDVEIGIFCWPYDEVIAPGWNEENVIRHNSVRGARQAPIRIDRKCLRYTIEHNWVEGEIEVVEPDNVVRGNTRLEKPH